MAYRRLFIFVEGPDDLRFFEGIVKPRFEGEYDWVEVSSYAELKPVKVDAFIRSIEAMGADYLLAADMDDSPCITERKNRIRSRYQAVMLNNIIVVVREIECWYLSGLDERSCKKLGMKVLGSTDALTKEEFLDLKPKKYDSRIDWMRDILQAFSVDTAIERNRSIRYFFNAWLEH